MGGSLSLPGRVTLYAPMKRLNTFVLSNEIMNGTDQGGNKVPASTPGECLTGVPAPILPLFLSLSLPFARLFVRWMSFFSSLRGRDKAFTEGFGETNMVKVSLMRLLRILSKEAPGCCRRIMRKEKGREGSGGASRLTFIPGSGLPLRQEARKSASGFAHKAGLHSHRSRICALFPLQISTDATLWGSGGVGASTNYPEGTEGQNGFREEELTMTRGFAGTDTTGAGAARVGGGGLTDENTRVMTLPKGRGQREGKSL